MAPLTINKTLLKEINEEIKSIVNLHGLEPVRISARFDDLEATIKIKVQVPSSEPKADYTPAEKRNWELHCHYHGFAPTDLGREFPNLSGDMVKIIGIRPKSRKYPILIKAANGRRYRADSSQVRVLMNRQSLKENQSVRNN